MTVRIERGDSRDVVKTLADGSVDAVCTDPPYGIAFMGRAWDAANTTAFDPAFWAGILRVLKPGGHLVAFGGTRTYHRLACAIEDAGFEIRDQLAWTYGSGFPKSHNVGKAIDKAGPPGQAPFAEFAAHYEEKRKAAGLTHAQVCAAGKWHGAVNHGGSSVNWANGYGMPTVAQWAVVQSLLGLADRWKERVEREQYEREVIGRRPGNLLAVAPGQHNDRSETVLDITAPATDAARQWEGWGTALKPAWEPIVLARKPLIGTVAANVQAFGTGALNIDGCRIETSDEWQPITGQPNESIGTFQTKERTTSQHAAGRWPANLVHDGSEEVLAEFARYGDVGGGSATRRHPRRDGSGWDRPCNDTHDALKSAFADTGSAARFFFSAKAGPDDRCDSKHPTVKPVALMRWLARLITPPGGTVLDPFAGSGTTGVACIREGFDAILIEREAEYVRDIRHRIDKLSGLDAPLFARVAP